MANDAENSEAGGSDQEATMVTDEPAVPAPELVEIAERSVLTPNADGSSSQRYEVGALLGQGGTSRVYAAEDRDLEREIAVKVVYADDPLRHELFVREARVMASLGHPNIPPIYDVGASSGALYLTTRRITGRSLGDAIRGAVQRGESEALPLGDLLETMLKLCDAVSYAHARAVIHQDIKPDNIMIGEFGEVVLVDWGAASASSDSDRITDRVIGTPAYMAPEQAQGKPASSRSDVYALGATLFHALLLRRPIEEPERTRFWRRKLKGDIDRPTPAELERLPRPVVGIALKAMNVSPDERYASVADLAQALRDFQAGRSAWSAPLVVENFADESFRERWVAIEGDDAWAIDEGRLVSRAQRAAVLFYKKRLSAGVALEFEGEMLPGADPGDLSVVWVDGDVVRDGRAYFPPDGVRWSLQVGAYANLMVGIYRDLGKCVSGRGFSLEVGRKYRIRAEIGEHTLRISIDGEVMAEYEDLFRIPAGYVGLYAFYPGKAFADVRIY
ncbi:MAG TPA: serine/threonine-protein kinase, partial [Polyangiaceae bacterium]|nr:serine/threonine-protein kinase [Polyangiaceae bacterium]